MPAVASDRRVMCAALHQSIVRALSNGAARCWTRNSSGVADGLVITERPAPDLQIVDYASSREGPWRRRTLMARLATARKLGHVGGRKRRMTESKIKSAQRLLAGGTPPRDVAENLGVSVPNLYRWLRTSARP